jgi:uncharacterized protein YbaR (Trm112 family)
MVEKRLLDIMACPKCRGNIELKGMFILCRKCRLAYPVLDDVPDMLIKDAWPLDKAGKEGFRHRLRL